MLRDRLSATEIAVLQEVMRGEPLATRRVSSADAARSLEGKGLLRRVPDDARGVAWVVRWDRVSSPWDDDCEK